MYKGVVLICCCFDVCFAKNPQFLVSPIYRDYVTDSVQL